jgi:hypothetical protein
VAIAATELMTVSCNKSAETPSTETTTENVSETTANKPAIEQEQVQGSWELISITGEGANFEMLKGTVLKFDLDKLKKTQNTNDEAGLYYILNGQMHYTPEGLNEVVWKVAMVDGNLLLTNDINQTLTYKKND